VNLLEGNPLLEAHGDWLAAGRDPDVSEELTRSYAFAVPTESAIAAIVSTDRSGIVEIGAGLGYWAAMLSAAGLDVVAYDIAPPPSEENQWFSGRQPWHPVLKGDASAVADHAERALLIVWPTRNEVWPAEALERYRSAGGQRVIYVGQGPGGVTGDERFHALLGEVDRCTACAYELADLPCICGTVVSWRREQAISLPGFDDQPDDLRIYSPVAGPPEAHAVISPRPPGRRSGARRWPWSRKR
jgi:hypothetical protein